MGKLMGVMLGSMGIVVVLGAVFAFPLYHGNIRFTAWMSPVVAKACAAAAFAAVILVVNWLCYRVGTRKLATVFLGVE
jgi:membrane glycosyltransferase